MAETNSPGPWNTVWVIGASFGIGEAFARLCSSRSARVIVSARSGERLEDLAAQDSRITPMAIDVTDEDQVAAAVAEIQRRDMLPDLTLYNAGYYEPVTGWQIDAALFAKHMAVNYQGAVHTLSALLPPLVARGSGHIGLVASLSGYCGLPKATAYGPSKAALISLAESLKLETDDAGIDLSVINPGFVDTRLTEKNDFKMPYLMTPEDAARAIHDGLARKDFEIAFPRKFVRWLKFARMLPYGLYFKATKRLVT